MSSVPLHLSLIIVSLLATLICADNSSATAEADLLWPVAGETFSLNPKGMAVVFALQNYAKAQEHGWKFSWLMCTPRDETHRECAFEAVYSHNDPTDKNSPVVLRNGETDGDVHIEVAHSFWYSDGTGNSTFDYSLSGVYLFEWRFQMGAYCWKSENGRESEYGISKEIANGSFNITIDATGAPNPTMTAGTCASFLGAVSYTNPITSWDFGRSVANSPGCVGTASVTKSPESCRATLDAGQIGTAMSAMGWVPSTPTATGTTSEQTHPANANIAGNIRVGAVEICILFFAIVVFVGL
jgi:hypothetical protein